MKYLNTLALVEIGDSPIIIDVRNGCNLVLKDNEFYDPWVYNRRLCGEISAECEKKGFPISSICESQRYRPSDTDDLDELLSGAWESSSAYIDALEKLAFGKEDECGFSLVLHLDGFSDLGERKQPEGPPPGALCFGLGRVNIVPAILQNACSSFLCYLKEAGYTIHPMSCFEYRVIGIHTNHMFGPHDNYLAGTICAAGLRTEINLKTPFTIMREAELRIQLAKVLAGAISKFIKTAVLVIGC